MQKTTTSQLVTPTQQIVRTFRVKLTTDDPVRFGRILKRDSRMIKYVLKVARIELAKLISTKILKNKSIKCSISLIEINNLFLTSKKRKSVKYDLKKKFPRASVVEIQEAIKTAQGMIQSHLELEGSNYPDPQGNIPRTFSKRSFEIRDNTIEIFDSLDTNLLIATGKAKKVHHHKMTLTMELYPLVKPYIDDVVSIRLVKAGKQLFVDLAVKYPVEKMDSRKPFLAIGLDLGVKKPVVMTAMNKDKIVCTKVFEYRNKSIKEQRDTITELQKERSRRDFDRFVTTYSERYKKMQTLPLSKLVHHHLELINERIIIMQKRLKKGKDDIKDPNNYVYRSMVEIQRSRKFLQGILDKEMCKDISRMLNTLEFLSSMKLNNLYKTKRLNNCLREERKKLRGMLDQTDAELAYDIVSYLTQFTDTYTVYVGIGDLTGILNTARKGNGNKAHRKRMHEWSFYNLTQWIQYQMSKAGFGELYKLYEGGTSMNCYKCNKEGIRSKQEYFRCPHCGVQLNADTNGSSNISKRLIKYKVLIPKRDFGRKGIGLLIKP